MNKLNMLFAACILACSLHAYAAESRLTVTKDDFSNSNITSLGITSNEGNATLFVSCYPESKIDVQLFFDDVIFPDDLSDSGMVASITHKFDIAASSHTENWRMNPAKYHDAWYQGNKGTFLDEASGASRLSVRLNRNGDIVRFDFLEVREKLKAVMTACGSAPSKSQNGQLKITVKRPPER